MRADGAACYRQFFWWSGQSAAWQSRLQYLKGNGGQLQPGNSAALKELVSTHFMALHLLQDLRDTPAGLASGFTPNNARPAMSFIISLRSSCSWLGQLL